MEVLLTLLSICTFFVLCVDSGNVLGNAHVSGINLLQVCNPLGLNGDTVHTKQTKGESPNKTLAWLGAFVQYTPWMEYNDTFPGNDSQVGQCSVFNFGNNISFNSKRCSETSHPVCYTKKNSVRANKGYENNSTWSDSMRYCKDTSPSSVENLKSAVSDMPPGTYWTTSVRAATFISVQVGKQESAVFYCVAAWVSEDYTIEERVIEHCDKTLPVLCLESTTETELKNSGQTTVKRHTTPNHIEKKVDDDHKSQITWEVIAGIIGGIGILFIVVLVIVKYRKRSLTSIEKSVAVTDLNVRNPNASNEETLEADNANIYDAGKSEERCVMLKDSNYDSMSAIRQDTEGVYDHTNSTQNAHGKNEDLDIYDHADPVIVKQSLQIENDGVYNQCELNIKSVIAKAHLNSDTTIYDHA